MLLASRLPSSQDGIRLDNAAEHEGPGQPRAFQVFTTIGEPVVGIHNSTFRFIVYRTHAKPPGRTLIALIVLVIRLDFRDFQSTHLMNRHADIWPRCSVSGRLP